MVHRKMLVCTLALAVTFSLALPTGAVVQATPTDTISGCILDPQCLVAHAARVVVESANTDATRGIFSHRQGLHSVPELLPEPYNLTVQENRFKRASDTYGLTTE